ncbi:MAG: DNA (cytosine-5-)-methyltransferase [Leptospirales bacterium]|nr:DNA (cytosine-5-)-methyltransferase [Leptospirales bacterium]
MAGRRGMLEFFAGGGMAACALQRNWQVLLANEISASKSQSYRANFPRHRLIEGDVASLRLEQLPHDVELAWSSFPCQDLSLAGRGRGLAGERSGVFFHFWRLIKELRRGQRAPGLIAIENVIGLASRREGADLLALLDLLAAEDYWIGALALDAAHFLPQSRPRLIVLGVDAQRIERAALLAEGNGREAEKVRWDAPALQRLRQRLTPHLQERWIPFHLPEPTAGRPQLEAILDEQDVEWDSAASTAHLLSQMSATQRARLEQARKAGDFCGALFRRTRRDKDGRSVVRAECRFDGMAGCLRTPAGGSSRQILLQYHKGRPRSRLFTPRETARLMGLPDTYILPQRANEAYRLTGDGLAVPAAAFLDQHLLTPLCKRLRPRPAVAP